MTARGRCPKCKCQFPADGGEHNCNNAGRGCGFCGASMEASGARYSHRCDPVVLARYRAATLALVADRALKPDNDHLAHEHGRCYVLPVPGVPGATISARMRGKPSQRDVEALQAIAKAAAERAWPELKDEPPVPVAEQRHYAATDPATGERIYVRISDSRTLTPEEEAWLSNEAKEGELGRTFYEVRFRAVIERLLTTNLEVVICAAIRLPDGRTFRGHRHGDCIAAAVQRICWNDGVDPGEQHWNATMCRDQGFITSRNRYVDREEGLRLQLAAGVASVAEGGYRGQLYSEDLY